HKQKQPPARAQFGGTVKDAAHRAARESGSGVSREHIEIITAVTRNGARVPELSDAQSRQMALNCRPDRQNKRELLSPPYGGRNQSRAMPPFTTLGTTVNFVNNALFI